MGFHSEYLFMVREKAVKANMVITLKSLIIYVPIDLVHIYGKMIFSIIKFFLKFYIPTWNCHLWSYRAILPDSDPSTFFMTVLDRNSFSVITQNMYVSMFSNTARTREYSFYFLEWYPEIKCLILNIISHILSSKYKSGSIILENS